MNSSHFIIGVLKEAKMTAGIKRILLVWLMVALFDAVISQGPQIQSVEYVMKTYTDFDFEQQSAVVTATFDRDIFINASCNHEATTEIVPCLGDEGCIDDSKPTNGTLADVASLKHYYFTVANPTTCDSIIIYLKADFFDLNAEVSFVIPEPTEQNSDASLIRSGSDLYAVCCSKILDVYPSWNGSAYITVKQAVGINSTFSLSVITNTDLDASEFYWLPKFELECDGNVVMNVSQCEGGFCLPFPPTSDPMFSYFATFLFIPDIPQQERRKLANGIYIRSRIYSSIESTYTILGIEEETIVNGNCQIRFPFLYDSHGDVNMAWFPLTRQKLECSASKFAIASGAINSIIDRLTSPSAVFTISEANNLLLQSSVQTIRNEWVACQQLVELDLTTLTREQITIENTRVCYATNSSSEEFIKDPCCNRDLQLSVCCIPRSVTAEFVVRSAESSAIGNTCASPRCSQDIVGDYVNLQRSGSTSNDVCQQDSVAALTDPIFRVSPYQTCHTSIFRYGCIDNSNCQQELGIADSLCLGVGYCTIPCASDSDCLTGQCVTVQNSRTCLLYDLNGDDGLVNSANGLLVKCLLNNTNAFVKAFLLQELDLSLSASNDQLETAFTEKLSTEQCQSVFTNPNPKTILNETACESIQTCNWAFCNDAQNPQCNQANCLDPNVPIDQFCQVCFGPSTCFTVSQTASCEYIASRDQANCLTYPQSHYNPLYRSGLGGIACQKLVPNAASCFDTTLCSASEITGEVCTPKCYFPAYTDSSSCTTASGTVGTTLTYLADPGLCVTATTLDRSLCDTLPGSQWWPGTVWFTDLANTKEVCEAVGYCFDSALSITTESACITSYFCENFPAVLNEGDCGLYGFCNDYEGCHVQYNLPGCPFSNQVWTPNGCYTPGISAAACNTFGGVMLEYALTREECLAKGQICQERILFTQASLPNLAPSGMSNKNASECSACNGEVQPFYKWTQVGRWIPKQWSPFKFHERNFTQANKWVPRFDGDYFQQLWSFGVSRRYSNIVSSRILCRFGAAKEIMSQLACDCGAEQLGGCFADVTTQTIRVTQVCDGVANKIDFPEGSFEALSGVRVGETDCAEFPIAIVPLRQFVNQRKVSLSSSSVTLSQSGRIEQFHIIKNQFNTAVGEVIASGIQYRSNITIEGAVACYRFPDNYESTLDVTHFDLASISSVEGNLVFVPFGFNMSLETREHCHEYLGDDLSIFPVALIDDWQEATFIEGLFIEEVFVIYFGVALYLIVIALWIAQLISLAQKKFTQGYFQLPTSAFYILGIALLDRVLFLFLLPVGVFEQSRVATTIFAELPALLYYTIFSLIVLSWAKVYHSTKSLNWEQRYTRVKITLITMNAFIGAAFIVTLIVFFSLDSTFVITCEQDLSTALTPQEIVGIIYKIIFALFCLALSILFAIYGSRLIRLSNSLKTLSLNDVDQSEINKTKAMIIKKTIVTVIGTVCLLGQAANLIRASFSESNVFILFFIYCVELIPVVSFLIILKKANYLQKNQKSTATPKRHLASHYKPIPAQNGNNYGPISKDNENLLNEVPMKPIPTENHLTNIPWSDIRVLQDLGEGNFGTVSLGLWKNIQVALKRCKDPTNQEFLQEAQLMVSIPHHPQIVKAFGTAQEGTSLVLVMEYCNGLSLDKKLFDLPDILDAKEKLSLMISIARGITHLHKNHVIHRDLAARNILLDSTGPKISDFGLSKKVENVNDQNTTNDTSGPIRWMSPEALRGIFSAKTDVWSFGIVMYEIITQCEPHIDEDTLFVGIKIRDQGFSPDIPRGCDPILADVMTQCWRKEPSMRPDMETVYRILNDKWKADYNEVLFAE